MEVLMCCVVRRCRLVSTELLYCYSRIGTCWLWYYVKMSNDELVEKCSLLAMGCCLTWYFNSLWPGRFKWNFRWVLFKSITVIDGWDTCCEIALRRMSLDPINDKSTLVQVMAWCRQATSHYLSQCWPRSLSPYGVTRPQWVNLIF